MRVRCSAVSVPLALILVSVLLLLPVLQPAQAESRTAPLEALSWERRVLLLFADHPADPWAYKQRLDLLEDRCDFNNRDLVLLEVYADHAVRVTGVWLDGLAHEEQALSEAMFDDGQRPIDSAALRTTYGIPQGFGLGLVGKDGWEKRRSRMPVSAHEIYAQIDGMPMRQREMRDDNCAGPATKGS